MKIRPDILELRMRIEQTTEGLSDSLMHAPRALQSPARRNNSLSLHKDTFQSEMKAYKIYNANVTQAHNK
jgi:hypothetical protein